MELARRYSSYHKLVGKALKARGMSRWSGVFIREKH